MPSVAGKVQVLVDGRQLLLLVGVGSPPRRVHGLRGAAAPEGLQGLHRAGRVRSAGGCGEDPPGGDLEMRHGQVRLRPKKPKREVLKIGIPQHYPF